MGATPKTTLKPHAEPGSGVADKLGRKSRSERILLSEGVALNKAWPTLEVSHDVVPRQKEEIAMRALCLLMTAIKAELMDQTMVLRIVRQYGLAAHFSPAEKQFIRDQEPSDKQRGRFSWRYESAWVLLWALGYVERLCIPRAACDVAFAVRCMRDRTTTNFIRDAKLRPFDQILDQADLIYRYHCALVEAALAKRGMPANLNPGIVDERHYAFNWLIRHCDQHWDNVTAET